MIDLDARRALAETNRRRYEELRAAGQGTHSRALPALTPLSGAPISPPGMILAREDVPGGWYASLKLRRGEAVRITDLGGKSSVSMIGWRSDDPSERINCADTVKVQWSASLRKGRIILTDMGRVLLSIVEDTSGGHDALAGGSTPASNLAAYGQADLRNTRENFVAAAAKLGLGRRDIPPCVSWFAPASVDPHGQFAWDASRKRAGDFVDLRAEMDALLVFSNCPHPFDPTPAFAPGPISLVRYRAPAPDNDDLCRTFSAEAERAFAFTDRLYA
jgi:urea carboxylase-associated protein 2